LTAQMCCLIMLETENSLIGIPHGRSSGFSKSGGTL
jgi:hypothetical protein